MAETISPDATFIFDVDGVITDPHTKIPNPLIISFIVNELQKHKPVAIGTGRSAMWLQERLIPLIQNQLSDVSLIDYLFLAGEKGSVTLTFLHGSPVTHIDEGVVIPDEIRQKIQKKVKEYPTIFDNGKKTMVSIEIEGGEDEGKIKKEKEALDAIALWIDKVIQPAKHHLLVERSVIALDIQQARVSK